MASAYRSPAHVEQVRDWCRVALARSGPARGARDRYPGGQTHVVSVGAGDRICVYLPGTNFNASSSTVVLGALGALGARCRVYTADLPGQPGLSATTRPNDELSGYADWVTDLIDWVRRRHIRGRIVLAGHSRGAAVALSANPDSVDGPALFSPAGLSEVRPSLHAEVHRALAGAAEPGRCEAASRLHVRPRTRASG